MKTMVAQAGNVEINTYAGGALEVYIEDGNTGYLHPEESTQLHALLSEALGRKDMTGALIGMLEEARDFILRYDIPDDEEVSVAERITGIIKKARPQ